MSWALPLRDCCVKVEFLACQYSKEYGVSSHCVPGSRLGIRERLLMETSVLPGAHAGERGLGYPSKQKHLKGEQCVTSGSATHRHMRERTRLLDWQV